MRIFKLSFLFIVLSVSFLFFSCENVDNKEIKSFEEYTVEKSTPFMDAYWLSVKHKDYQVRENLPNNYDWDDFTPININETFELPDRSTLNLRIRGNIHKTDGYIPSFTCIFQYPNGFPESSTRGNEMTPKQFAGLVYTCLTGGADPGCVRETMSDAISDCEGAGGDDCTHCWMFPGCA